MLSPYGLEMIESCLTCKVRAHHVFCDLPDVALKASAQIKFPVAYPKGAIVCLAGPR
jgi:hypothetical protein